MIGQRFVTVAALVLALALLVALSSTRNRLAVLLPAAPTRLAYRFLRVAPAALSSRWLFPAASWWPADRCRNARRAAAATRRATAARRGVRRPAGRARAVLVSELSIGAPVAASDVAATEVDGAVDVAAGGGRARTTGRRRGRGSAQCCCELAVAGHWERLAVSWQLAQTHGLAIATLMRTAQRDIVERERFSARVASGMAGARTTAAVLAGLRRLGVGLGQLIGADPVRFRCPAASADGCWWLA